MRTTDLLKLSMTDLWQRKLRSVFTLAGIVLGTILLLLVVSGGVGVMRAVEKQYRSSDELRRIQVYTHYVPSAEGVPEEQRRIEGEMSETRRARLEAAALRLHPHAEYTVEHPISPALLDEWAALDHVELVQPDIYLEFEAEFHGELERVICANYWDPAILNEHLVAGEGFAQIDEAAVVIHEYQAYQWGAANEADVQSLIGEMVHLEYRENEGRLAQSIGWMQGAQNLLSVLETRSLRAGMQSLIEQLDELDLPEDQRDALRKAFSDWNTTDGDSSSDEVRDAERDAANEPALVVGDFRIVGVFRDPQEDEQRPAANRLLNAVLLMPDGVARSMADPVVQTRDPPDYSGASVLVDSEQHLREVQEFVTQSGVDVHSLVDFIDNVHLRIRFITLILAGLSFAALIVAGLGIANTTTMSVLQRSREIGIMKAVGARDRQILMLFLAEGLWLGLLGAAAGIAIAVAISHWLTGWVRGIVEGEFGREIDQPMFAFPPAIIAGLVGLVILVTVTASLVPALRAARIDPIRTLKSE